MKVDGKERIETTLNLKVIHKLNNNMYVVGDETDNTLLETNQDLDDEIVYKILKPKFIDDRLHAHPNFKLLKTKLSLKIKSLSQLELDGYLEISSQHAVAETLKKEDFKNFSKCETFEVNKTIEMITLLIISKSRDIEGRFGKYNIITAKDFDGQKNSVNIYHDKAKIVQTGKILTFTILKKTNFKPENTEFH